jgi:predicted phage terminase large subunit-like protein
MTSIEEKLQQDRILKHMCESDLLFFERVFFKHRERQKFIVNRHHRLIADTLQKVVDGEIKRLIINIPPGYTKTEMVVISFIAWCLTKYPDSKFIHSSYSDDLAVTNSATIRGIIKSNKFQSLWPMTLRDDTASKKRWFTEQGGGMHAVSSGGQITGFRAGRMRDGFSGAILIDDPLKPDDAYSDTSRNRVNNRFTNTFKSRLAVESVPIIIIMQRLHEDDLTGFLLAGGSGEKWHHLEIPVEIEEQRDYPTEYTCGVPVGYDFEPGPLWEYKHDAEDITVLKADEYTYASQYDQRPAPLGGGIFKKNWWQYYSYYDAARNQIVKDSGEYTSLMYKIIYADTAMKIKEVNDWSVLQCWGKGLDGNIYILDQWRGKWEAPELLQNFLDFCEKHQFVMGKVALGVRARRVEDKVSGTGLIQTVNRQKGMDWVTGIQRDKDKVSRAMSAAPAIAQGRVHLPSNATWLGEYIAEFSKMTPQMSHKHDDQIDPTLDAVHEMLIEDQFIGYADILK